MRVLNDAVDIKAKFLEHCRSAVKDYFSSFTTVVFLAFFLPTSQVPHFLLPCSPTPFSLNIHISLAVFNFLNFMWCLYRMQSSESFPFTSYSHSSSIFILFCTVGMMGMPKEFWTSNPPLCSSPDIPSYSPDTGNSDSIGHSPCQGPHEQDRGPAGRRGSCGAGPVRLLQEGEGSRTSA